MKALIFLGIFYQIFHIVINQNRSLKNPIHEKKSDILTKPNPNTKIQRGVLEHPDGRCFQLFVPTQMKYRIGKNLTSKSPAFIRLEKNCSKADEWQVTERFLLTNLKYNAVAHTVRTSKIDGSELLLLIAYGETEDDDIEQFAYLPDGQIVHISTNKCIKALKDEDLRSEKLKKLNLLVLSEECKNLKPIRFRQRSYFDNDDNSNASTETKNENFKGRNSSKTVENHYNKSTDLNGKLENKERNINASVEQINNKPVLTTETKPPSVNKPNNVPPMVSKNTEKEEKTKQKSKVEL